MSANLLLGTPIFMYQLLRQFLDDSGEALAGLAVPGVRDEDVDGVEGLEGGGGGAGPEGGQHRGHLVRVAGEGDDVLGGHLRDKVQGLEEVGD